MNSIRCPQCGMINWATVEACKRCGAQFANASEQSAQAGYADNAQQAQGAHGGWQGGYQGASYSSNYTGSSNYAGQQSAPGGGPYANYYTGPQIKKSEGLAMTSMIVGILSFFTFWLFGITPVMAFIMGVVALRKARKYPHEYGGQGFAIAGIVTSCFSLIFFVGIVAAIAIPNLLASRKAANEGSAVLSLRVISASEATYQATAGRGNYGRMEDLQGQHLLDDMPANKIKNGYKFNIRVKPASPPMQPSSFEVVATPIEYGPSGSGRRLFFMDESGVIRTADRRGMEADGNDPPLGAERYGTVPRPNVTRETPGSEY